jgi:hypothetical protein
MITGMIWGGMAAFCILASARVGLPRQYQKSQ